MILSVSRRTDVPAYYSEWFFNRMKAGRLYVRNPINFHQVASLDISPEVVDCIVFWTKNPAPMMERLDELKPYNYYFQFTLTGYGKDVEPGIPDKKKVMIPTFQKLSEKIGKERVIWRYDPIFFSSRYTPEYHLKAFEQIASALSGYTEKVVISFMDFYRKTKKNTEGLSIWAMEPEMMGEVAKKMAEIAGKNGLLPESCAEKMDMGKEGISHGSCIDKRLIERIAGYPIAVQKSQNQRPECGCVESVDAGAYDTCLSGCRYCYANYSQEKAKKNLSSYDVLSPLLCSGLKEGDRITEKQVFSLKDNQLSLF